jgi:hypothetical protein
MRQIITVLTVIVAIVVIVAVMLYMEGALGKWREALDDPLTDAAWTHILVAGATLFIYRFAYVMVTLWAKEKRSARHPVWPWLRWVLMAAVIAWFFGHNFAAPGDVERGATIIKLFVALLAVGFLGTWAGVRRVAFNQQMSKEGNERFLPRRT